MKRTKLSQRLLPSYTRGEEIANMVTHIVGGGFGVVVLLWCCLKAILFGNGWDVTGACIYGISMVLLYTVSSVYHGLKSPMGKKVMQVIDHCTIYLLIAGTYTPILLSGLRPMFPGWAWTIFGIVWGCAVVAAVFTAIDLKKYAVFSMVCYLAMGWCIVLAVKPAMQALPTGALLWILVGGIAYTVGAVLYGIGSKVRWMHSVFHIFVVLGSLLQAVGVIVYAL